MRFAIDAANAAVFVRCNVEEATRLAAGECLSGEVADALRRQIDRLGRCPCREIVGDAPVSDCPMCSGTGVSAKEPARG